MAHSTTPSAFTRLTAVLRECRRTDPSGAFRLDGDPPLLVQLRDGDLLHAETADVPGLGARLVARGRITPAAWADVSARAAPRLADWLVAEAVVTSEELTTLLREVLVDALLCFALNPAHAATEARPSPGRADRPGRGAPADDVLAEVRGLVEQLAGRGLGAGAVLERCADPPGPVVVTSDQWTVVWRADGRATARDVCRATGLSMARILLAARGLVASGVCRPVEPPGPVEPVLVVLPPEDEEPQPLPRRDRGATIRSRSAAENALGGLAREPLERPDRDTLRRILQALRKL